MKITFRTPRHRPPIFRVGDEHFIDFTFDYGNPIVAAPEDIIAFMAASPPGSLILARRVSREELEFIRRMQISSEHEIAGNLLRDGAARWQR